MLLRHSNDTSSFLVGSKAQSSIGSRFLVIGERGWIRINSYDSQESELRKGAIPDQSSWGLEPPSSFAEFETSASGNQTGMNRFPFLRGRWNFFYNEVFNSITNGTASPVPISDAINNMRVLDAARKSHINRTECLLHVPATHITKSQFQDENN